MKYEVIEMILVIGNFGANTTQYNGQSQRTKNVFEGLVKYSNQKVCRINTANKGILLYINIFLKIFFAKRIVILPGESSLLKLCKMLHSLKVISRCSYVVIGGWLPDYLDDNLCLLPFLQEMRGLYVQTESMVKRLVSQGVNNVDYLPNFRFYEEEFIIPKQQEKKSVICYVFYARVTESKGIEILIKAFNKMIEINNINAELHIYGVIDEEYKERISKLIDPVKKIKYMGILKDNHLSVLSKYDVMVFPTHYEGEGFPGTILESILSGVPIIASDWKYNREIVEKYRVGIIHSTFSEEDLYFKMLDLYNNSDKREFFREQCIMAASLFNPENIIKNFMKKI